MSGEYSDTSAVLPSSREHNKRVARQPSPPQQQQQQQQPQGTNLASLLAGFQGGVSRVGVSSEASNDQRPGMAGAGARRMVKRHYCRKYFIYNPVVGRCRPTAMVSGHGTRYTVQFIMYSVYGILYSVQCTVGYFSEVDLINYR